MPNPTKQAVREYLTQRREQGGPPPTPEQIRRELGWTMIQAERKQDKR